MKEIIGIIIIVIVAGVVAILAYRNNQKKVEDAAKAAIKVEDTLKTDVEAAKDKVQEAVSDLKK